MRGVHPLIYCCQSQSEIDTKSNLKGETEKKEETILIYIAK